MCIYKANYRLTVVWLELFIVRDVILISSSIISHIYTGPAADVCVKKGLTLVYLILNYRLFIIVLERNSVAMSSVSYLLNNYYKKRFEFLQEIEVMSL